MGSGTPGTEWPLTEKGRNDATALRTHLARGSSNPIVWTSPERRARDTAALAFPSVPAEVWTQLGEVKKPWSASVDAHAVAVATSLRGEEVDGWEPRPSVLARIAALQSGFRSLDSVVAVSHGLFLTIWIDEELGLSDPFAFWSSLGMPDAWELNLEEKSLERSVSLPPFRPRSVK
jgi:broad specificity phosphatase PhoE